jgi:ribokinase
MRGFRPGRLVGLASILVDLTVTVTALPARGGDILATGSDRAAGGGVNALAAAARLGLPAAYAGPHGTGPNGDTVRAALADDGIAVLAPPTPGADTGWCLALVEPDGERTFVTVTGAEAEADRRFLAGLALGPADAVYASGYDLAYPGAGPVLGRWLAALPGRGSGGPLLVFDPGPLGGQVPVERLAAVLGRVDLLSLSTGDAARLGGPRLLAERVARGAVVVLRQGVRGALLLTAGEWLPDSGGPDSGALVPAVRAPGPVLDTNGAGDVHLGALLAGLHAGLDLPEAATLANRAAAVSVTRAGANSGPTTADLAAAFPS